MKLPPIITPDGRRAWAFAALVGGAMTFTLFAAYGVYQVRNVVGLTFWLALAAHAQVFVVLTGLAALLIKRTVSVTRDGVTIDDKDAVHDGDRVTLQKDGDNA
jgi:membrane protein implicated in regulation of membrane protease activity